MKWIFITSLLWFLSCTKDAVHMEAHIPQGAITATMPAPDMRGLVSPGAVQIHTTVQSPELAMEKLWPWLGAGTLLALVLWLLPSPVRRKTK